MIKESACAGEVSEHCYPRAALVGDLLGALAGLTVCTALIVLVRPADWLVLALAFFAGLFAVYAFVVVRRCRCRIEMDSRGLRVFATPASSTAFARLDWEELDRLKLDYFCTRRDGRGGWLQLRIRARTQSFYARPAASMRFDSRLLGFEQVLTRALGAARARGVAFDAATATNLSAIGFADGPSHSDGHSDGHSSGQSDDRGNDDSAHHVRANSLARIRGRYLRTGLAARIADRAR